MESLFAECSSLEKIREIINWNVKEVKHIKNLFNGWSSLSSINNLPHFNSDNITDISYLFSNCSSLESINISNEDFKDFTNISTLKSIFTLLFEVSDISISIRINLSYF